MSREFRLEFSLKTPDELEHEAVKFFTKRILDFIHNDDSGDSDSMIGDSIDWHANGYSLSLLSAEEIKQ